MRSWAFQVTKKLLERLYICLPDELIAMRSKPGLFPWLRYLMSELCSILSWSNLWPIGNDNDKICSKAMTMHVQWPIMTKQFAYRFIINLWLKEVSRWKGRVRPWSILDIRAITDIIILTLTIDPRGLTTVYLSVCLQWAAAFGSGPEQSCPSCARSLARSSLEFSVQFRL